VSVRYAKSRNKLVGFFAPDNPKQRAMIMHFVWGVRSERGLKLKDTIRICAPPIPIKPNEVGVFFGLSNATFREWRAMNRRNGKYVYIDNCYLGDRGFHFRVTPDAVMAQTPEEHPGEDSNGKRFEALGIRFRPWRRSGRHILVCLQSELYFKLLCGTSRQAWVERTCRELRQHTDRPIILRDKPNRDRSFGPIEGQLENCHAVVTWNSTSALEAIRRGVPAYCLDPNNSFRTVCQSDLATIEEPMRGARRLELFQWLADNQWTKDEIESGRCWTTIRSR